MKVLNQGDKKTCANYAVMAILLHKGIAFDLTRMGNIRVPYMRLVEELFRKEGLLKEFKQLPTPKLVDIWLKKGEWLITSTSRGDFTLNDNKELNVVEFDEKSQHFFVIVKDCGDRWKCLNSWGEEWGEGGYFYIKKEDFRFLFTPSRIIC